MEDFNPRHLRSLLSDSDKLRLTCYMPVTLAGRDRRKNPTRFKNCIRDGERALRTHGLDDDEVDAIVEPLIEESERRGFWEQQQREGFAMFASRDRHMILSCNERFHPSVTVGKHYSVVQLLPLINRDGRGYVLALSRERVRLIEMTRDRAEDRPLDDSVPQSVADVVGTDVEQEYENSHTIAGGTGSVAHGGGVDDTLQEVEQFCRTVDEALANEVDHADSPIVAAGDVNITSVFRRVAKHLAVLDTIDGNHDRTSAQELHALAWPLVAERIDEYEEALVELFEERRSGERASDSPEDIARAASEGRVDTLLLNRDVLVASALDGPRTVSPGEEGEVAEESLFNSNALATLRHGGAAWLLDGSRMPHGASMAAIYRY